MSHALQIAASQRQGLGNQGPLMDPASDLAPWKPTAQDPWDQQKAAHLMRRSGFGARPEEIEAMVTLGADRCIDLILSSPGIAVPDHGTVVLPTGEILDLSTKANQQGYWYFQMAASPWSLVEKMALFWHDHFATGISKVTLAELMGGQINTFRRLGLGTFRELLLAVSRDPAMLYFLDNWLNTRTRVQENYGREVLELFSMGVDAGYTEFDVKASAHAFTGWTTTQGLANQYVFRGDQHDYLPKTLLTRLINNPQPLGERDGNDVVETILAYPATAKYMVRKILEYFVIENPAQVLVDFLAADWARDGYRIRPLMGRLFRSRLFFSPSAIGQLVKNPVEYLIGAMRSLGTIQVRYSTLGARITRFGFDILNYQDPSGLEDGVAWINSTSLIERSNAMMELTRRSGSAISAVIDPGREIVRKGLTTANQVVDHYLSILVDGQVPAAVRTALYGYMVTRNGNLPYVFDINNATSRDYKVRGLIHMIMLLPEYHTN